MTIIDCDPLVDDAADQLVNPRPSKKTFASFAEREAAHALHLCEAATASAAGDLATACMHFQCAYALLFRRTTLLALVDEKLKQGEAELAAACYAKVLESDTFASEAQRGRLMTKLADARRLCEEVRTIVRAPQSGVLNTAADRERGHRRLVERARAANEVGEHAEAEAIFLEAWPLTFRASTLVSAANMMMHQGGHKLRVAYGLYHTLLGSPTWYHPSPRHGPVTEDERLVIERKLAELNDKIGSESRKASAAGLLQRVARGRASRRQRPSLLAMRSAGGPRQPTGGSCSPSRSSPSQSSPSQASPSRRRRLFTGVGHSDTGVDDEYEVRAVPRARTLLACTRGMSPRRLAAAGGASLLAPPCAVG